MAKTELKMLDNGPILINGEWDLKDATGKTVATGQGTAVAICRCGASAKKPYCDGAHKKAGFQSKNA